MQAACDSLARSSSTCSRAKAFSSSGAEVSTKSCTCALRCTAHPLVDVSHAYLHPRMQEPVSKTAWQVFFLGRASTRWSSCGRRGSPISAMRTRGGLRMSGVGACTLCEGPCSSVGAAGVCASDCGRTDAGVTR